MRGDPGAIRASAGKWSSFGSTATQAGGQITALDTSQFVGPEGDQFRDGLDAKLPDHLRVTGDAFTRVADALNVFAGALSGLQDQMRPLAVRAPGLWEAVRHAQGALSQAQSDDRAHARQVAALPPEQRSTPDTYRSQAGAAGSALSGAQRAWQECLGVADRLRSAMGDAVGACKRVVDDAAATRFKDPPKWYDLGGQFTDFVRDNKDLLQHLSGALKVVSLVAGVLSFIPILAPVMAPLAIGTALAASAIDASVYAATGEGDLKSILIDVGLNLLPGVGKLARLGMAGKAFKSIRGAVGSRLGGLAETMGSKLGGLRDKALQMFKRTCKTDPVDVATGEMVLPQIDVELDGALALVLSRVHLSSYRVGRWFGESWASTLDQRLEVDDDGVCYAAEDGMLLVYPTPEVGVTVLPVEGPRWSLSRTDGGGFSLHDPGLGRTLHFAPVDGTSPSVLPLQAISDRDGHRIDLDYNAEGMLTEVRHTGGYRIGVETADGLITALSLLRAAAGGGDVTLMRYGYDVARRLTEVVNSSGQPLRLEYDAEGRIVGWRDRNGVSYHYTYDEAGRCVATSGSDGFMDGSFVYDRDLLVTVYTNSLGHKTTFHLNEANQVIREIDPLGGATVSEWDRYDRLLGRVDPLGRVTRYGYDQAGDLIAVTRPDGSQAVAEYNALGLPVMVTDPGGARWRRTYDERGNLTAVTDPAGVTTRFGYDGRGHVVAVTDALGQVRRVQTDFAGLVTSVTDPLGATTRYARDGFGRVSEIIDPVGGVTRFGWTVEGKPAWQVSPDGATEQWSYDGEGNLVEHVDALGQVTRTEFTHFDLPAAQIGPDGARLGFAYDTELRLTAVTNPQGLVWRYDYDAAGNLVRETDFNGRVLGYSRDGAGQLMERVNGVGQAVRYSRDLLGNVVEQRSGEAVATFGYDAVGWMVRAVNADAEVVFDRDLLGRVVAESCNGRIVASSFDVLGRRVTRRTPSGAQSVWEYGTDDQPVTLQTAGHTIGFGYDAAGREIERRLGTGAVLAQSWDVNHRLNSQTLTAPGLTARQVRLVQSRSYNYRSDGYVTAIEDHLGGPRRFDLDVAGRVTAVHGSGWSERYAYDPAGNVTEAAWPPPQAGSPDVDARGERAYTGTLIRRAGNVRYEHDAQGRVTLRQQKRLSAKPRTWHYTWDADDRLVAVVTPDGQQWRYSYDALGRRIAKHRLAADGANVVEHVSFSWDGTILAEQTQTGPGRPDDRITTWEWEPGSFRPVTQTERVPLDASQDWVDQQFYAIVTDLVGTPTELVEPDGTLVWRAHTTLWGTAAAPSSGGASCPLRFPGQYHDPETGLNYNYHRYYDPADGRYQNSDPLSLAAGPNSYCYVVNPTRQSDPLGLMDCERAKKLADRISTRAQSGNLRRSPGYHGRVPAAREQEILSSPEGIYRSTGTGGRFIFHQGGDVVVAEGTGSRAGQIVTSYGPSGPRGASGVAVHGGAPTDPGLPITHDMIVNGTIPTPGGGNIPPGTQILP